MSTPAPDRSRTTPQDTGATGEREHPRVSLRSWTQQMDAYTGPDTLLDFNQVDNVCIDLTEANSSGQAQLLMGRPTRLSTMIHQDSPAYERAVRSARALRTKVHELSVMHGLDASYLAAGTASWLADPVADNIVEALRVTREVGGTDLGKLLGTLSEFLRENERTRSELEARQSWTVNAARLSVAAPWLILALMATQPAAVRAYNTATGAAVLLGGLAISVLAYQLMLRLGALPTERRVLR